VRDRISQSLDQLSYVEDQVARIQARLDLELDETKYALDELEEEWKAIVTNA